MNSKQHAIQAMAQSLQANEAGLSKLRPGKLSWTIFDYAMTLANHGQPEAAVAVLGTLLQSVIDPCTDDNAEVARRFLELSKEICHEHN